MKNESDKFCKIFVKKTDIHKVRSSYQEFHKKAIDNWKAYKELEEKLGYWRAEFGGSWKKWIFELLQSVIDLSRDDKLKKKEKRRDVIDAIVGSLQEIEGQMNGRTYLGLDVSPDQIMCFALEIMLDVIFSVTTGEYRFLYPAMIYNLISSGKADENGSLSHAWQQKEHVAERALENLEMSMKKTVYLRDFIENTTEKYQMEFVTEFAALLLGKMEQGRSERDAVKKRRTAPDRSVRSKIPKIVLSVILITGAGAAGCFFGMTVQDSKAERIGASRVQQQQSQISDLQREITLLQDQNTELNRKYEELAERASELELQNKKVKKSIKNLADEVDGYHQKTDQKQTDEGSQKSDSISQIQKPENSVNGADSTKPDDAQGSSNETSDTTQGSGSTTTRSDKTD